MSLRSKTAGEPGLKKRHARKRSFDSAALRSGFRLAAQTPPIASSSAPHGPRRSIYVASLQNRWRAWSSSGRQIGGNVSDTFQSCRSFATPGLHFLLKREATTCRAGTLQINRDENQVPDRENLHRRRYM